MRVHVDTKNTFLTQRVNVYVLEGGSESQAPLILHLVDGDQLRWDKSDDDDSPTFWMPMEVAEKLGPLLVDLAPPNATQAEALRDTRAVRDRLLTLVERLAGAA